MSSHTSTPASRPEQLHHLFSERANAADIEGMVALYEEGATLIVPDGVPAVGVQAIRERLTQLLAFAPRFHPSTAGAAVRMGELALMSNSWRATLGGAGDAGEGPGGARRAPELHGTATEIARRQPDGSWLYVLDDPISRTVSPQSSEPDANLDTPPRENSGQLLREQDGPVVRLVLNRPERRNALSIQLSEELIDALEAVRRSRSAKVLVIEGAGETFCAGDDITEMGMWGNANEIVRRVRSYQRMADTLAELDKITIAAVDGFAVGGGLEITMACDFVIATRRASWGMPEVDVGITPGWGGTTRMSRLIGRRMTKEINLLGALHPASLAVELGLWNRAVEHTRLAAELDALIEVLLSKNQQAMRQLKFIIDRGVEADLNTAQGFEALSAGLSGAVNGAWQIDDADQASGVMSFIADGEKWKARRALARDFWTGPRGGVGS
jgi:enoyl-CoA hydratase/carnithine racemase/ketosteroid isomerase-like protein